MFSFSPETREALHTVWAMIHPDCPEDFTPSEKAELLIDAGRLTIHGYPEAQEEVSQARDKLDYDKLLNIIANEVGL